MMLQNLKLGSKLSIIFVAVFFVIISTTGLFLSQLLERNMVTTVASKADLLMDTMQSVRTYTSEEVRPELADRLESESEFIKQTVPGYSARQVFENLRQREHLFTKEKPYQNFFYKEATLNPTNPLDKANAFEEELVQSFRNDQENPKVSCFRTDLGAKLFYVANPIKVEKESCLRCHSTPAMAPKSQLETYGAENGFGWELNEIVGAQIVSVPASDVLNSARTLQMWVIGSLIFGFLIALAILNLFLKRAIILPIQRMSTWAQKVSTGDNAIEYRHHSRDEIGILAASLNRLKVSLDMAMDMLNPSQPPNDSP